MTVQIPLDASAFGAPAKAEESPQMLIIKIVSPDSASHQATTSIHRANSVRLFEPRGDRKVPWLVMYGDPIEDADLHPGTVAEVFSNGLLIHRFEGSRVPISALVERFQKEETAWQHRSAEFRLRQTAEDFKVALATRHDARSLDGPSWRAPTVDNRDEKWLVFWEEKVSE